MKKFFLTIAFVVISLISHAQYSTEVTITDLYNESLTSQIEESLSGMITEFNMAFSEKRQPKLSAFNVDASAQNSILMLWENSPFRCEETDIVEAAMKNYAHANEFEVRNLPFVFPDMGEDDQYHEVAITFNTSGKITSFHISVSQNVYRNIFKANATVTDLRRRQMILDYVEQFRTAYNTKDISFMQQVFSDDALIITGRVITTKKDNVISTRTEYLKKNKTQYINDLKRTFQMAKSIKVSFDDIKVMMHPTDRDWYGVQLRQGYSSENIYGRNYHDDGYLFLLWDFTNDDRPQIHVRVWQDIKDTKEADIFTMDDVDVVR